MLDQIVQAATSCCGISGGVGLLLVGPTTSFTTSLADRRRSVLAGAQLPERDGPSVDAFVQDALFSSVDLAAERRWPAFGQQATAAGLRAWLSVPLRQRHGPIGALDLARTDPQPWQPQEVATGGAFARLIMPPWTWLAPASSRGLARSWSLPSSMTPGWSRPVGS